MMEILKPFDPSAGFHIISKDSGFDALIKHLAGKGIVVCRAAGIAGIAEAYRSHKEAGTLLKKVIIEIAVNDEFVKPAMDAITEGARTG